MFTGFWPLGWKVSAWEGDQGPVASRIWQPPQLPKGETKRRAISSQNIPNQSWPRPIVIVPKFHSYITGSFNVLPPKMIWKGFVAVNNIDDALTGSDLPLKYLITLVALIWSTAAMSLEEPEYTILRTDSRIWNSQVRWSISCWSVWNGRRRQSVLSIV